MRAPPGEGFLSSGMGRPEEKQVGLGCCRQTARPIPDTATRERRECITGKNKAYGRKARTGRRM